MALHNLSFTNSETFVMERKISKNDRLITVLLGNSFLKKKILQKIDPNGSTPAVLESISVLFCVSLFAI